MKVRIRNTELAREVSKQMKEQMEWSKLLQYIDDTIEYQSDYPIDENGELEQIEVSEIELLIEDLANGIDEMIAAKREHAEFMKADERFEKLGMKKVTQN